MSFSTELLKWYRKNARDLPWRQTRDPYHIWISEIMLQQTTVAGVISYYKKWIKRYPSIAHVARAREESLLKLWQGLGYYQRVRNLHQSAKIVCREFDGQLPENPELLKTLPGFGDYTVGAVASIAFNKKIPVIDANVRRVIKRILCMVDENAGQGDNKIYKFLKAKLLRKNPGDFNQALMELGALVCRPKAPGCFDCPVRQFCQAYKKGLQEQIPSRNRRTIKTIEFAAAVISRTVTAW